MKLVYLSVLIVFSSNLVYSQPAILYTAGEYPCNGKDLWKALKIEGCSDGSCFEYRKALEIIEKECRGTTPPPPSPDPPFPPGEDCLKWGIRTENNGDNNVFNYFKVIDNDENCWIDENTERSLNLNTSKSFKFYYQIAISNNISDVEEYFPYEHDNYIEYVLDAEEDVTSEVKFLMVLVDEDGIWIVDKAGTNKLIEIDPTPFLKKWKGYKLLERIAIIKYVDSSAKVILQPTSNSLKVLIKGKNSSGISYLVGIDEEGNSYKPINLSDEEISGKLIDKLVVGKTFKNPVINELIYDWFERDSVSKEIKACVEVAKPKKFKSPQEVWSGYNMSSFFNINTFNLTFMLDDGSIKGSQYGDIEETEYHKVKFFDNSHLAILFIADPNIKILDRTSKYGNRVMLIMGASDNLYILKLPVDNSQPLVKTFFDSNFSHDSKMKRINMIRNNPDFYIERYKEEVRNVKFN